MKKNILLVANWDSNVGYAWWLMENFWSKIANEFTNKGYKCFLIYPSISTVPKTIQESPIQIIGHNYADFTLGGLSRLISIIRKNNIGYIYLTDKPETSVLYILFKLCGVKIIFIHDHTPGERTKVTGLKLHIKKLYKRFPFINADTFIAVTDYIRTRMLECSALPAKKCFVAKNGIIPIGRNPEFRYYCHDKFSLPRDSILIISTGRAHRYKRVDLLINAFAKIILENNLPNLYFIYCGEGPHLTDFKELASKLNVDNHFIFTGKRNDVKLLLQSCDIGVQASQGEVGYSLSILEYMSAGLATLVPDNPSVCQSIIDGYDGLYYESNDLSSLCIKLLNVIRDEELRNKLGKTATQSVESNYRLEHTNDNLIKILSRYIT